MPRIPGGFHYPAGGYRPAKLAWGPAARPIGRLPVQGYRPVQGIPLQPSTAQATIGGATVSPGGPGNFAQVVGNNATGLTDCEIWADPNCAGGQSSVTVNFSSVEGGGEFSGFAVYVLEFSGINTVTPTDKTNNSQSTSSATFTSGATGVLSQADEVIVGAVYARGSSAVTLTGPAAPWLNFAQATVNVNAALMAGYQIVSATTSLTYSGSVTGTPNYGACIASFKATGTPALVQSPPAVTLDAIFNVTTASVSVNLTQPTGAGNCLIVAVGAQNGLTPTPIVSGITTAAGAGSQSGLATVQLGPAGLGNIWYPTQVTLATTTGITTGLDSSVANLYMGPSGVATYLLGTVFGGNGIVAAALPNIQPGLYLIAKWTGGNNGDTATMNVQGVMNALA